MRTKFLLPFTILFPPILLFVSPLRLLAGPAPDQWEIWSARPALMPATRYDEIEKAWHVEANGKASHHGGWELHWNDVQAGKWYRFEIECRTSDLTSIHDNAHAELIWWKANGKRAGWKHVRFSPGTEPLKYYLHVQAPEDAVRASARLMLRWTDRGKLVRTNNHSPFSLVLADDIPDMVIHRPHLHDLQPFVIGLLANGTRVSHDRQEQNFSPFLRKNTMTFRVDIVVTNQHSGLAVTGFPYREGFSRGLAFPAFANGQMHFAILTCDPFIGININARVID